MAPEACPFGFESSRKRFRNRDCFAKVESELDGPGTIPGDALFIEILKLIK
jgi:hypothetical protein